MEFVPAKAEDKTEILKMYRDAIGDEGCTWSMDYPNKTILEGDYSRNDIFVMKEQGDIIGAVSIDDDKEVEALSCWSQQLKPSAEAARLIVKKEYRNRGIARLLLQGVTEVLQKRKYKSIHYLVSKTNLRAIHSYAKLNFTKVGESDLYGENWLCYEKELNR